MFLSPLKFVTASATMLTLVGTGMWTSLPGNDATALAAGPSTLSETIVLAQVEEETEEEIAEETVQELADENAVEAMPAKATAKNGDNCFPNGSISVPAPMGPMVCVSGNRMREDGHYIAYISYEKAVADVELELQSASRDILVTLSDRLPEELRGLTPVLIAQMSASDGDREIALGLQANLGAGIIDHNQIRFPLYSMVGGVMKEAPIANTIEARLENPFTGLPRSFNAEQVTMYLWVQFGLQRYPLGQPLTIDLLQD